MFPESQSFLEKIAKPPICNINTIKKGESKIDLSQRVTLGPHSRN